MTNPQPPHDFAVSIDQTDPRAESWRAIFGSNTVPIEGPATELANLPGHPAAPIYRLKLSALTEDQLHQLATHLAAKFGGTADEVLADINTTGVPVLAENTTLIIHNPAKWID